MAKTTFLSLLLPLLAAGALAACSPEYNWRDYSSPTAPYRIMFPGKPESHTRSVNLRGLTVDMTMTATEVNGVMYAVGSAELPDAARSPAALAAMQTAMLRNIGATPSAAGAAPAERIDIDSQGMRNETPMRLVAHFEARGKRVYQVIVLGKASSIPPEHVKQFMSSFKLI